MQQPIRFLLLLGMLFLHACTSVRYIPAGETLYKGASIHIKKDHTVKKSNYALRKSIRSAIKPKRNKFLLGRAYKVWWWYVIGEPKRNGGFKTFLRDKLGEPPVLGSMVNPVITADNIQALLENQGYFHSITSGDTFIQGHYLKARYQANVMQQYTIRNITWVSDSSKLRTILHDEQAHESLLKSKDAYNLETITAERSRLDILLKTRGYYYFNPDYLMAYADSTIGNHQIDLYFNIKREVPEKAKHAYSINSITLYTAYQLSKTRADSLGEKAEQFDGLTLINNTKYDPVLFKRLVTYRPPELYSITEQNKTLNRFINLGVFKFVKTQFVNVSDSQQHPYALDVRYYITPNKKKSFQAQIDAFSKENKYMGSQLSINWRNRNLWKKAELLTMKTYGGFEISFDDSLKKNNNFRTGAEATLLFPRFVMPFLRIKESNFYTPHTRMLMGYEWFRKQGFYSKNIFRLQYEFNWKETSNKEHTLAPVAISYIRASNVSEAYYAEVAGNPSILANVYSEVILGSFYSYTLNTLNPLAHDLWYLNTSVDISGNVAGLITHADAVRESKVLGSPFAQYVKGDLEIRYQRKMRAGISLANRLQIGASMPYHNSNMLPFSKQYVVGGSNSIRGFQIKQLGPGSYLPNKEDQKYFLIIGGDYKLLLNSELRIPLIGSFHSAVFVDAGNTWTKGNALFGEAGRLKKNSYQEIAVAAGIGLRYDLRILLIRLDLGMPLRKPYNPLYQRWVFDEIAFADGSWRRNNLLLNIAIGYPF